MMTIAVPKAPPKRRRGGRRLLIVLGIVVLLIAGGVVWLNVAAQAQVSASGMLTVYQPTASIAHNNSSDYSPARTGTVVAAGDSVQTDTKGLAAITLPDGTITRLATNTTVTLNAAHFNKSGSLHDVSFAQGVGRTFTNVQHLVSGATFDVHGKSATASVRGTKFEVLIKEDGTMTVKLFEGRLVFTGKNGSSQTLVAPQQATADANGNIGPPGPIQPDPTDPFGPALDASNAVAIGTTPGTEQDFTGAPIHNGQTQVYTYAYAGGSGIKASLGYPGSLMSITVKSPDGQSQTLKGKSPVTVQLSNPPAGIYTITVKGESGLGNPGDASSGESPFVAVASVEDCVSAIPGINQNGAVHRGYTAQDLVTAVQQSGQVSGLSNLQLTMQESSVAGAIISATGTFDGFPWTGSIVLVAHDGTLDVMPTSGHIFGLDVPAQQLVQQIATAIGQDPSNVNPGFVVDRLFTCNSVLMIDGRLT